MTHDAVNHPRHYTSHPSGVECIDIIEWMPANVANAMKYCWRAGLKDDAPTIQDYQKAVWYLNREVKRLEKIQAREALALFDDVPSQIKDHFHENS